MGQTRLPAISRITKERVPDPARLARMPCLFHMPRRMRLSPYSVTVISNPQWRADAGAESLCRSDPFKANLERCTIAPRMHIPGTSLRRLRTSRSQLHTSVTMSVFSRLITAPLASCRAGPAIRLFPRHLDSARGPLLLRRPPRPRESNVQARSQHARRARPALSSFDPHSSPRPRTGYFFETDAGIVPPRPGRPPPLSSRSGPARVPVRHEGDAVSGRPPGRHRRGIHPAGQRTPAAPLVHDGRVASRRRTILDRGGDRRAASATAVSFWRRLRDRVDRANRWPSRAPPPSGPTGVSTRDQDRAHRGRAPRLGEVGATLTR